jgi:hypothetical protein
MWIYTSTPKIRLHGLVLNSLGTGTPLLLPFTLKRHSPRQKVLHREFKICFISVSKLNESFSHWFQYVNIAWRKVIFSN